MYVLPLTWLTFHLQGERLWLLCSLSDFSARKHDLVLPWLGYICCNEWHLKWGWRTRPSTFPALAPALGLVVGCPCSCSYSLWSNSQNKHLIPFCIFEIQLKLRGCACVTEISYCPLYATACSQRLFFSSNLWLVKKIKSFEPSFSLFSRNAAFFLKLHFM